MAIGDGDEFTLQEQAAWDAGFDHAIEKRKEYYEQRRREIDRSEGYGGDPVELVELDTLELLTTEPSPLLWLADGIWARGAMTMFGGREKGGKSLVQLVLAAAVASGRRQVAGIDCRPGRVLLVDAENGRREIHRRLKSIGLEAEHAASLIVAEARGFDLGHDLAQLVRLIDRHQPDVVILDSFRSLWRGDERDEAACAAALYPISQLAQDRNIAVSLTHHAKKDGSEYRGSTAIGAVPDWVVMLSRQAGDEDKTRRKLSTPMCRIDAEREDRWLAIAKTFTGVELHEAGAYTPPDPPDEKLTMVLEALTDATQSEREIGEATGLSKTTARNKLLKLERQGWAAKAPGGWVVHWSTSLKEDGPLGPPGDQLQMSEAER